MLRFQTTLLKFGQQGEKTGWTYIAVPVDITEAMRPGFHQSYRVKGKLDDHAFKGVALIPMGDGQFIIPFNAAFRKATRKHSGAMISVEITEDKLGYVLDTEMMACLADEPAALAFFQTLNQGHQNYFSKWVEAAKTAPTRARRIAQMVDAMIRHMDYPSMIRANSGKNQP